MKAPAKSSASSSPAVSIREPSAAADPGHKPGERRSLDLFARLAEHEHEQVSLYYDPSSGYRGIIAIHSTVLGPALGIPEPRLHIGEAATAVLFDPGAEWTVDAASLQSRSSNTPLLGSRLRGRVLLTLCKGRVAHRVAERIPITAAEAAHA